MVSCLTKMKIFTWRIYSIRKTNFPDEECIMHYNEWWIIHCKISGTFPKITVSKRIIWLINASLYFGNQFVCQVFKDKGTLLKIVDNSEEVRWKILRKCNFELRLLTKGRHNVILHIFQILCMSPIHRFHVIFQQYTDNRFRKYPSYS